MRCLFCWPIRGAWRDLGTYEGAMCLSVLFSDLVIPWAVGGAFKMFPAL